MAKACDQCRRVPAHSDGGEYYQWIKLEEPLGVILSPIDPRLGPMHGMKPGVNQTTRQMVFCCVPCLQSYLLGAAPRILQIQRDTQDVLHQNQIVGAGAEDVMAGADDEA